jgi:hypothetical protein
MLFCYFVINNVMITLCLGPKMLFAGPYWHGPPSVPLTTLEQQGSEAISLARRACTPRHCPRPALSYASMCPTSLCARRALNNTNSALQVGKSSTLSTHSPQTPHFSPVCGAVPRALIGRGPVAISSNALLAHTHTHPHPLAARVWGRGTLLGGQAVVLREVVKKWSPRCRGTGLRSARGPTCSRV